MRSAHHMDKPLTATAGAGCGAYHGTRLQCRQGSSGGGPVVVLLPAGRGRGETRRVAFACVQREPRCRRGGVPVRAAPAPCLVRAWSQRRPPRYRRRSTGGIRESGLDRLRVAAGEAGGTAGVDSTVNRARRHAAGAPRPPAVDASEVPLRRSRRRTVAGAGRSRHSWEPDCAGAFEGYAGGLVVSVVMRRDPEGRDPALRRHGRDHVTDTRVARLGPA